jgi:aspartate/methionine/tyrosine aminotransferase
MKIPSFETEHFFAQYEFTTPYQLCNSDCETVSVEELLKMADIPMEQFGQLGLGYTDSHGNPKLRQMIAELYTSVDKNEVIVLGSPIEGIYLTARAALNPGDEVIVLSPAYDALIKLFEHIAGAGKVHKWEFVAGEGQWLLDLEDFKRLITPKTKLVVVNFPHNPTGYLPTQSQLDELAGIVEAHNLILFCDEMYFGLVHSGTPPITSAADATRNAIVLSGLSKTYGLPGLRSGWLVIHDEDLRQNIINWKFYTSICPPAPTEFLAMAALKVRSQLRDKSIHIVEQNLPLADAFFQKWPELFTWRKPLASSTALIGMNVPSVRAFAARIAEKAGVLILPAATLGSDDQHMRMGFGRAGFEEALNKFDDFLNL